MPQFVFSNIKLNGEFSIKVPELKMRSIKNHFELLMKSSIPITNTFMGFFIELWMMIENAEMIKSKELTSIIKFFQEKRGEVNSKQRFEFVKCCAVDVMNCYNRFGSEFFNEKAPQVLERLYWKLGEVQMTTSFILLLMDYKSNLSPETPAIDSSKVKEWFYRDVEKDWFISSRSAFTEQLRQPVWVKWILKVEKNKEERRLKEKLNAYEKAQLNIDVLFITAYSLFSEKATFPSNFLEFFNEKYQDMVQLDLEKQGTKDLTKLKKKWNNAFELMKTFFSRSKHSEPEDLEGIFNEMDDDVPQLEDQMDDDEEIVLQKGTFKFNCRG
jgi:hypothetical protein